MACDIVELAGCGVEKVGRWEKGTATVDVSLSRGSISLMDEDMADALIIRP